MERKKWFNWKFPLIFSINDTECCVSWSKTTVSIHNDWQIIWLNFAAALLSSLHSHRRMSISKQSISVFKQSTGDLFWNNHVYNKLFSEGLSPSETATFSEIFESMIKVWSKHDPRTPLFHVSTASEVSHLLKFRHCQSCVRFVRLILSRSLAKYKVLNKRLFMHILVSVNSALSIP